jgi:D-glycero-alpha-D-manno-heptose-7-phosphate kinase
MIISKTPYRISFFGGGSDYPEWYKKNEGEVISTSINHYLYITLRDLPPYFDHKYLVSYSQIERVKKISEIKHRVIKLALSKFNINNGLEIHYDGDIPSKSGMGSSSAFVVGFLNCLSSYKKKKLTKFNLANASINFEQKILKENVGSQDQVAVSYGGFNNIKFKKKKIIVTKLKIEQNYKKKLNDNLFLYFTGQTRIADHIVKGFKKTLNSVNKKNINQILEHVDLAKKIIDNRKLDDFGYLLDETWNYKKQLSKEISNTKIDDIYAFAKKNGSLGGKLLGAGGGGFMLFYVPKRNQGYFKKKMKKYLNIPFRFSENGSEIIFNNMESKIG